MEAFAILHTIRRSSGEGEIYMNKKEFTMACAKCFSGFGFEKVKRSYAKKCGNIVIIIEPVKSNYDNYYWFEYGYIIREINDRPCDTTCNTDLRGSFGLSIGDSDKMRYDIWPEQLTESELIDALRQAVPKILIPENTDAKKFLIGAIRSKICYPSFRTKEYLGMEDD